MIKYDLCGWAELKRRKFIPININQEMANTFDNIIVDNFSVRIYIREVDTIINPNDSLSNYYQEWFASNGKNWTKLQIFELIFETFWGVTDNNYVKEMCQDKRLTQYHCNQMKQFVEDRVLDGFYYDKNTNSVYPIISS